MEMGPHSYDWHLGFKNHAFTQSHSVTCLPGSLCAYTDFSMIYLELDLLGHRVGTHRQMLPNCSPKGQCLEDTHPHTHLCQHFLLWSNLRHGANQMDMTLHLPCLLALQISLLLLFIAFAHFSIGFFFSCL